MRSCFDRSNAAQEGVLSSTVAVRLAFVLVCFWCVCGGVLLACFLLFFFSLVNATAFGHVGLRSSPCSLLIPQ